MPTRMNEKQSARIFLGLSLAVIGGLLLHEINEKRKEYFPNHYKETIHTINSLSPLEQQIMQTNNPAVNEKFMRAFNYATQLNNKQETSPIKLPVYNRNP